MVTIIWWVQNLTILQIFELAITNFCVYLKFLNNLVCTILSEYDVIAKFAKISTS